ncbi:MAG: hypothetical protein JWR33_408, partial [Naasia sp.]|uniref:hypothetical protein n=1 Tax=Naasia sp. TaxID=2546198 RepID=UPI00262E5562
MKRSSDALAEHSAALAQRVAELASAGDGASLAEVVAGAPDADLVSLIDEVGTLAHLVDALAARLSGEFAARSSRAVEEPLAKRLGERSAAAAVAAITLMPVGRAADWCSVGQELAVRRTLAGEPLPSSHPGV